MELTIRISNEEYKKLDIKKAMSGNYIDINSKILLMSMHVRDGALDEMQEKAELWDNLPDDVKSEFI